MARLSIQDREAYLFLRGRNLLKDVEAHRIDMYKGAVCVICSCPDHFDDAYANIAMTCLEHRPSPRICLLTQRGGALAIPGDSPLNLKRRGENLLQDIFAAHEEDVITTVALYAHAPCTSVNKHGLGLVEVIDLLVRAKISVKTEAFGHNAEIKVACFVHIDRGQEEGPRTYFVSADEWRLVYRRDIDQVRLSDTMESKRW